ncbi:hypothetical protein PG984_009078 [Apiospora sp. TS-2023a]
MLGQLGWPSEDMGNYCAAEARTDAHSGQQLYRHPQSKTPEFQAKREYQLRAGMWRIMTLLHLLLTDVQNPFRGVKFQECKASFPQDSLVEKSKCKLKDKEESRFCPTTRFWYWGQPQPFKAGYFCGKHAACDISQQEMKAFSDTTTNGRTTEYGSSTTFTYGFELGFEVGFGAGDAAAAAGGGAARLKPRQDGRIRTGLSFSLARTFSQSFARSTSRTTGYTDTSGVIATLSRPTDSMEKCGAFYVVPQYQGVMASTNSTWDQFFTCGNRVVNGTSTEDPAKKGHAYHTVWVVLTCEDHQPWGPELQDERYNQAIVWSDWALWLMHKKRDSDQTITLEGSNSHRGKWFGFEVRDNSS